MSIMDWVTFWIAVIGFCLSTYNFVALLVANHKRIDISVKKAYNEEAFTVMLIEFTNKSQLPISITSGKINGISFGDRSATLYSYANPDAHESPVISADLFPIDISPLGTVRVLLRSDDVIPPPPSRCPSPCHCTCPCSRYRICLGSSRGKISKNVVLPEYCESLLPLLEYLR